MGYVLMFAAGFIAGVFTMALIVTGGYDDD